MIEAAGLTKFYGTHPAIQDVSFRVSEGEVVAFLGPNGAGKSTTMRILTGYMPATEGTARIAGFDVTEESLEARRHVGYMPEHIALYPEMRVTEYLLYCGKLEALETKKLFERLEYVLEACSLQERADSIIATLSLGYRQRVGLAQALLHDPAVLILDEPTIGLDPIQIVEVRGLVKKLAGKHTILLSTHILPEAQQSCERVLIMNHGRIIAEGAPDKLTTQVRQAESYRVRVARPSSEVADRLRQVPDVLNVQSGPDGAYGVDTRIGSDPRAELSRTVVQMGWSLLEISPLELTLEDVFQALTMRKESAA
ncbi:MAG: ABC transporter ATP-binding protein [candidate division WS1 bacterium]|nr:ABC transporter ATP-binding protein [candidate division WS1 bacterium]